MSRSLALKALVARTVAAPATPVSRVTLGLAALDARLADGLAQACVHEIFAAAEGDEAAAAGFALLLAQRCPRPGPILWLREERACAAGRIYGHGLAELGGDPARLLLVQAPDTLALLRAAAEAVGCPAVATVIMEPWGKATALDLTATRRLALAAARSGVFTLLLRSGEPAPSAAATRWQVAAAPSQAPEPATAATNAPGAPAFEITLLRHRGGIAGFKTQMEWNRDRRAFESPVSRPPLPGAAPAAPPQRAVAADQQRAA